MNPRATLLLAVVAALLGGFIYFYEIGGEAGRKAADQADLRIFPGLQAEEIDAIQIETQDGVSASFRLDEGGWELVEPVRGPADVTAIDAMTSVLAGLSREGSVEAPGDLAQYGLGEGARTIHFEAAGESLGLRVGRATPVGGHLYVAPIGSDRVSYVETFRLNAFNRNFVDLRDRRVLPFEPSEATEIKLAWSGTRVELVRNEAEWRMVFPVEEKADSLTVRDFLNDLSYLRAKGFVDEADEIVKTGLEDVALEIQLELGEGRKEKVTIGGVFDGGRLVRTGSGRIFTIASERFDDFERGVGAYRFRTLSKFDVTEAAILTLQFASAEASDPVDGQRVVARLKEGVWTGEGRDLDSDRIAEAILSLSQLRALTVVADEMGDRELGSLGLSPPQVQIRVDSQDSDADRAQRNRDARAPLADVSIGRLDDQRGLYAQRVGDPKIYLLGSDVAESIPISSAAFQDRFTAGEEESSALSEFESEPIEPDDSLGVESLYP